MFIRTTPRRVSTHPPLRSILIASLFLLTPSATCQEEDDTAGSIMTGVSALQRALWDCATHAGPLLCLRSRLLRALDRALLADRLPLAAGVALVRQRAADVAPGEAEEVSTAEAEAVPEADAETEAEAAGTERQKAEGGLLQRLSALLATRSLQISLPGTRLLPHGRGKGGGLKKYGSVLLVGAMMKAAVLAIAFKGLALVAGAALLVAKLAFVLAAVVGLGKLLGGGGGGGEHDKPAVEYVKHPVPHEYGHSGAGAGVTHYEANGADGGVARWRRSLTAADAHPLAYSARARHLL